MLYYVGYVYNRCNIDVFHIDSRTNVKVLHQNLLQNRCKNPPTIDIIFFFALVKYSNVTSDLQ